MWPPEPPSEPPPPPGKRKKWTEAEERTLLDKYAEMSADGSLTRLRTRERRFRPIASHVNSLHHIADPSAFPFLWSWKDASTKVQNMRHQYSHVKHKLLLLHSSGSDPPLDPLSLWPNFHRYRDVFGDTPYEAEDDDDDDDDKSNKKKNTKTPPSPERSRGRNVRKRTTRRKAWAVVREQIEALREREERLAEAEGRERARSRRRREEEREWEEQMERRRADWRKRMEGAMAQHRAEMEEMRARALHDQQALLGQLLAVAVQWCGGAAGFAPGDAGYHHHQQQQQHHHHQQQQHHHQQHQACCFSQMGVPQEEGFNHVEGGMEHGEDRVGGGDGREEGDQFIVDDDDDDDDDDDAAA